MTRVPQRLRSLWHRLRHHLRLLEDQGVPHYCRWSAVRASFRVAAHRGLRSCHLLSSADLRGRRCSDTAFVFGSGFSLTQLAGDERAHFAEHETVGFSGFVDARWVPIRFHVIRAWDESVTGFAPARERAHNTARNGMIDVLGAWAASFRTDGVELMVDNPRSLLARVLPVYEYPGRTPTPS